MADVANHQWQLEHVPAAMRERQQWLVWRFESKPGDKKPRKVPYYANGSRRMGGQGEPADRAALVALDVAEALLLTDSYTGVGFAFLPGDGLIGIDLDNALNPETGALDERAASIVAACASFTEVTPSGKGLHIYVAHPHPENIKQFTGRADDLGNGVGLEMYCGSQFFTVSGRRWQDAPDAVADVDEPLLRRLKNTIEQAKQARRAPAAAARAPVVVRNDDERARIESALAVLPADLAYPDWIGVGMAIYDALGEGALGVWDYWSQRGSKYPGIKTLEGHWRSFGGRAPGTAGVIFSLAKELAGWKQPPRKKPAPVKPPVAPAQPAQPAQQPEAGGAEGDAPGMGEMPEPPLDDGYLDSMADMADWIDGLRRDKWGGITKSLHNTLLVLENDVRLRDVIAFDEFAYRIVKRKPAPWGGKVGEWSDADDVLAMVYLTREYQFEPGKDTLMNAVLAAALANRFNPLRDYLEGLVWDGVPRVRKAFMTYWGALSTADTASLDGEERARLRIYLQMAAQKWFVGAVARAMQPGCKLDTMVVFEGGQGARKSTSLRALFGDAFFADSKLNLGDKDALAQMQGKWSYEMGELDAFNKAEDNAFKLFMSSQTDRVRWHYGKRAEDVPRGSIFIGTTNQSQYGKDPTGMRRVWPFMTGAIDLEGIARDRDQLWAEAIHLWGQKARWWVDRDVVAIRSDQPEFGGLEWSEWDLFKEQADRRQIIDAWAVPVLEYIAQHDMQDYYTTAELMEHALKLDKRAWTKPEQMRVGALMTQLGYLHRRKGPKNKRIWGWVAPEKDVADDQIAGADDVPL